jgi:hypothetical protein
MGKWSREESMKYAFDVAMVELPTGVTVDKDELGIDHDVSMLQRFVLRWKKHLMELSRIRTFDLLDSFVTKKAVVTNTTLQRDLHGFRKIAVFATPRKVVAVDTLLGKVVWERYFESSLSQIFLTRESRHAVPPLITVYGVEDGAGVLITLNALTGEFYGEFI